MIVGRGMIADAFSKYYDNKEVVIFASGVSNSLLNEECHFTRERELLKESIAKYPKSTIVYFGTCSVHDPELSHSPYVEHKREMEKLIEKNCEKFFIFRLSQVVGHGSSPTLINFIVDHIKSGKSFNIWKNSTRNLIDVDDVFKIADYLIQNTIFMNEITNIATPLSLPIFDIVTIAEELIGKKGQYQVDNRGGSYEINIHKITPLLNNMNITFDQTYPALIIKKYFQMSLKS